MMNNILKKSVKITAVLAMIILILGGSLEQSFAVPPSNPSGEDRMHVGPGEWMKALYKYQKTIDLKGSGVDITLTDSEKKSIYDEADKAVLKWFVCSSFVMEIEAAEQYADSTTLGFIKFPGNRPYYTRKYWYIENYDAVMKRMKYLLENPDDSLELPNLETIMEIAKKCKSGEDILALTLKDSKLKELVTTKAGESYMPGSLAIRAKREEIINDLTSEHIVKQTEEKLGSRFMYDIVPLAEDGSEDAKFGIGKTIGMFSPEKARMKVQRGTLPGKKIRLSSVDFGSGSEYYDQILKEDLFAYDEYIKEKYGYYNGEDYLWYQDTGDEELRIKDLSWEEGKTFPLGKTDTGYLARDLRDLLTHAVLFDGADMLSSDEAMQIKGHLRESAKWPGYYGLLEVWDNLDMYGYSKYLLPFDGLTKSYLKFSNPMVTAEIKDVEEDLITDVKFDGNGKATHISKPFVTEGDITMLKSKLQKMFKEEYEETYELNTLYRYKLVESSDSSNKLPGGAKFKENKEEKILDILVVSGEITRIRVFDSLSDAENQKKYQINPYDTKDEAIPEVTFTNSFVEKNEESSENSEPAKDNASGSTGNTDKKEEPKNETASGSSDTGSQAKASDTSSSPSPVLLKGISNKGSRIKFTWTGKKGAAGYEVYMGRCNKNNVKRVKTLKLRGARSWTTGKLKKGKPYCAYVRAYKKVDGKKKYIGKSNTVHLYVGGGNGKYTNPGKVTVKSPASTVIINKGGTKTIKAKVSKLRKSRTLMNASHGAKLRYISSDKSTAKVTKKGKIKAVGKGTCKIYVLAINGARKSLKVRVA